VRVVCALPAGLIADRIGRKRSLFVGLAAQKSDSSPSEGVLKKARRLGGKLV